MADEDMDMDNDKEVSNHMDTDDKGLNHGNDRTAESEPAVNAAKRGGQSDRPGSGDTEGAGQKNGGNSVIPSGGGARHAEGRGSRDGTPPDAGDAAATGDAPADVKMVTEDSSRRPEGGDTQVGTAEAEKQPSAEETATAKGGEATEGMTTDDANEAAAETQAKQLRLFPKHRRSRPARRSYRLRNLESRAGDGAEPSGSSDDGGGDDDEEEEAERHDADSGTRSQRSRSSDSSATESDMERDARGEQGENKTGGAEIGSDLEDELLAKLLPKPRWRALPMLRSRELGARKETLSFRSESIGSAHMVSRFEKYCELKHHDGCVNTLHFNQSGKLLASGSDDLNIVLWDWARQKTALVYPSGHRSNVFQAKFMPFSGDTTIVSCARDGHVRVGELSSTGICKGTKKLVQHKEPAHKLGLEPDSPVVFLTCGEDAVVYNIDLRTSKANKLLTAKEEARKIPLYTIFLNPANTHEFCVGGRDHFVRVYDRRKLSPDSEAPVKKFCPQHLMSSEARANVTCCVYSYNGQEILASYNDEDIYLFDSTHSDGADFVHCYKGHRNNQTVKGVNFYGPQSQFVVSGSDCGNVFLWEKTTERIVQYMRGDVQGVVNCLESHPSSAVLATSGLDHDVKIWMPTAREPSRLEGLKRAMYSNRREREEEKSREADPFEGHMLMFLMQQLRRRARRQARETGEMDSDSSTSDSDSSEDEDEDGGNPHERPQCAPS